MDLQNIKTFICVAKSENFTKAAQELNYAQSTVTSQIQNLEEELGIPLFERIGRKNHLTAGGKEFLGYATEMLYLFQRSASIGKELKNSKSLLRIGVLESLLFANLLSVLPKLQEEFPNLEVTIKMGQSYELLSMLKQNQLDVIYISNALNTDMSVKCCYKRREELVFVSAPGHPLAAKENICVEDVFNCSFVVTEPTGYCFGRLREIASEKSLNINHNITIDSVSAVVSLIKDNRSIAFLPEYAIKDELLANTLVKLGTNIQPQFYYSQLLCVREKWISPFIDFLATLVSEHYPQA